MNLAGFCKFAIHSVKHILLTGTLVTLAACGGGGGNGNNIPRDDHATRPADVKIGVTVTGLTKPGLVLQNNGGDDLAISENTTYTFSKVVPFKGDYRVTVKTQPDNELCTVKNGSGIAVPAGLAISVVCSSAQNSFTIGGAVTGLKADERLVLQNNDGDALAIDVDQSFTFPTPVAFNSGYKVTVAIQPDSQTCTVSKGTGSGVIADVTDIKVVCSTNSYTIGGTISGLKKEGLVILLNNSDDHLLIEANNTFTFATPVAHGGDYEVTIAVQPVGQTCTVPNGKGYHVTETISDIVVLCSSNTFTISGQVVGLESGDQVTLANNFDVLNDAKTVYANEPAFTFDRPVVYDGGYLITVATQPAGKTCTVTNGTGKGVTGNITNIAVLCSKNTYAVGGTITGLNTGEIVILLNNSDDPLTIDASKSTFIFDKRIAHGSSYRVVVTKQPVGQTCTVNNGSGQRVERDVLDIDVACSALTYTVSGMVTGLNEGEQVTVVNNGNVDTDAQTVKANTSFSFKVPVVHNRQYEVTVTTQPKGQICKVIDGRGTALTNVTNVVVECSTNMYSVSGVVIDLQPGRSLTLLNKSNGSTDWKTISGNGIFSFNTHVPFNSDYDVSIAGEQPVGQQCAVINGQGKNVQNNITTISVECSVNMYTISGSISGISPGYKVKLHNNGDQTQEFETDAQFTFNPIAHGERYEVTVMDAVGQTCSVANGSGIATKHIDVKITCSKSKFRVGGTVSGLTAGDTLTLINHGDRLVVNANETRFAFPAMAHGSEYDVRVDESSTPVGKTCSVTGGFGTVNKEINDVSVVCSMYRYSIEGTLTGLKPGKIIKLKNNRNDELTVTANGPFKFHTKVPHGGGYDVSVAQYPDLQTCSLSGHNGINISTPVTSVKVDCYSVAVTTMHSFQVAWNPFIGRETVEPVGLMQAKDGHFYGASTYGGEFINGSLFKLTSAGAITTLHSFTNMGGGKDLGSFPQAGVAEIDGTFYGVTSAGMAFGSNDSGTIYRYSSSDPLEYMRFLIGVNPVADLIHGRDGNLYGISSGITFNGFFKNNGAIFKISQDGTVTPLHEFGLYVEGGNSPIGAHPNGRLIHAQDGYLYGTTQFGGTNNHGVIFRISPMGTDLKVLHRFSGWDGSHPAAGLVQASDGHFYGVTKNMGSNNAGTIFKMTPAGDVTTVHAFNVTDGAYPEKELIQGKDGYLYGVTQQGGLHNKGTIFRIASGSGQLAGQFMPIYSFPGKPAGGNPTVRLVEGRNDGHIYGTTRFGGAYDQGTFFRLDLPLK